MLGPVRLKRLREAMVGQSWKRKTINAHIKRICRIFHWAADDELIPASVSQALTMVENLKRGRSAPSSPLSGAWCCAELGQHQPNGNVRGGSRGGVGGGGVWLIA